MIAWPRMRSMAPLTIFMAVIAFGLAACRNTRPAASPDGRAARIEAGPMVVLRAGNRALPFRVELAQTDAERERGLMYRNHLDSDTGMLFIFEREGPLTFWMKNTLIPLDIIFIGSDRRIVGIVDSAVPGTETPRRVDGHSRYVLEIAGGMSRRLGIVPGSAVEFHRIADGAIAP